MTPVLKRVPGRGALANATSAGNPATPGLGRFAATTRHFGPESDGDSRSVGAREESGPAAQCGRLEGSALVFGEVAGPGQALGTPWNGDRPRSAHRFRPVATNAGGHRESRLSKGDGRSAWEAPSGFASRLTRAPAEGRPVGGWPVDFPGHRRHRAPPRPVPEHESNWPRSVTALVAASPIGEVARVPGGLLSKQPRVQPGGNAPSAVMPSQPINRIRGGETKKWSRPQDPLPQHGRRPREGTTCARR